MDEGLSVWVGWMGALGEGGRKFYLYVSIREMSTNEARLCPLPLGLANCCADGACPDGFREEPVSVP